MKKINSLQLISELENRTEQHLHIAVESFQNMEEKNLLKQPVDGGWSIAQCLWHLNSYGDYYLPEISKRMKVSKSEKPYFKSSWFGSYFTKMMEPKTGKRKIKAFKNHTPPAEIDAYAIVAEFIQQQERFLDLLADAKKVDLNKIRIPISISKIVRLKLGDVFQFLKAHDERHLQQALRVMENNRVPKNSIPQS